MRKKAVKIYFCAAAVLCVFFVAVLPGPAIAEEALRYTVIQLDKVVCQVAVAIDEGPEELKVEVSSYAVGQGTDFRKWDVSDIKLIVQGELVRQKGESEKFYTTKESLLRYPAAVAFAALGTQYQRFYPEYSVSGGRATATGNYNAVGGVANVMDKAGMIAGLGLLVTQAKGEITGVKSSFFMDRKDFSEKIDVDKIVVKMVIENSESHKSYRIKSIMGAFAREKPEDENL